MQSNNDFEIVVLLNLIAHLYIPPCWFRVGGRTDWDVPRVSVANEYGYTE